MVVDRVRVISKFLRRFVSIRVHSWLRLAEGSTIVSGSYLTVVTRAESLFCSRPQDLSVAILENLAVRQMRLPMILMAGAKSSVRDRNDRNRVTAAAAVHLALAPDRRPSRSTAVRGKLCCTSTCRPVCRRSEFPRASRSSDNQQLRGQSSS